MHTPEVQESTWMEAWMGSGAMGRRAIPVKLSESDLEKEQADGMDSV